MVALASHANAQPGQQEPAPQFQDAVAWHVGAFPWGVAAGDALGPEIDDNAPDGYPDLAVTMSQFSAKWGNPDSYYTGNPGEIWIYRNQATWTPTQSGFSQFPDIIITLPDETVPCGIEWAQMNPDQDTHLDLVVAVSTPFRDPDGSEGVWGFYVYRGTGNGGWVLHSFQPTQFPVRELTVADFNNDGYPDVAAAVDLWEGPDPDKDLFYLSLNDQAGHLLPETTHNLGSATEEGPMEIVSGQFDFTPGQQTLPDIFMPNWDSGVPGGMSYTNTGNAVFSGTAVVPMCGNWGQDLFFSGMAAGQFGGTMILGQDIAGVTPDGAVLILHGNGNGGFSFDCEEDEYSLGGGGTPENLQLPDVAVGSFNGGTRADLVVSNSGGAVHLFMGKGDGTFKYLPDDPRYVLLATGNYSSRVIAVDLDQNGFDDIVVVNHDGDVPQWGSFDVFLNKLVATTP